MSINPKLGQLKWSDLKGRAVVDITNAKRVGNVDDLVLNPQTYQIVGLQFKSGLFTTNHTVSILAIKGVGENAVTLQLEDNPSNPAEESTLQNLPTISHVIGNGVVTEGGNHVGEISNVRLSLQPFMISGYDVSSGGIFSKSHTFEITPEVHYGEKLVIIPDKLLDAFTSST